MKLSPEFIEAWSPRALAVLRIVTAFLFLQHATAKVFHVPHVPMFDNLQLLSFFGIVGLLELVAGLFILVGSNTRLVAFLLSGQMAVAYFMFHANKGDPLSPMLNGGEPAVLYCFIFLFMAVAGGGTWGIDALRVARSRFM